MRLHVVGIDASLTRTGVTLGAGGVVERCTSVPTKPDDFASREERIDFIISELMCVLLYGPVHLVVIEDYGYAQGTSAYTLGELGGCLRRELYKLGLPWRALSPNTIKHFATGSGRATKAEMVQAALPYWPIDNHDEADSLHACRYGMEHYEELAASPR